jgi:hypothetical protein
MALDGLRARTFTVENFSWESIVDRFEAIFINLKEYSKS